MATRHMRIRIGYLRAAAAISVALLLLTHWAFGDPGSPGRTAIRLADHAECWKLPHRDGVAAIGDSITIGTSVAGWPALASDSWVAHALCDSDVPFTYNGGVHSQTSDQIAARVDEVLEHDPAVLVMLVGTNDVYQETFGPATRARLRRMIDATREEGVVPVLGTVPPINGKAAQVEAMNRVIREVAGRERVRVIDFHEVLVDADGRTYAEGLDLDGLHPSPAGAELMGAEAESILADALAESGHSVAGGVVTDDATRRANK